MAAVLGAVGVALVVFGAFVLWKVPDRPGGMLRWRGIEVNSVGAGLPIMVLGVVAIAAPLLLAEEERPTPSTVGPIQTTIPAAPGASTTGPSGAPAVTGCFADYFAGIAGDRTAIVEVGAKLVVIGRDQVKDLPAGLLVVENGRQIGGLRYRLAPASELFTIENVVDATCADVQDFYNATRRGADKHTLRNFEHVFVRWGGLTYDIGFASTATISVDVGRVA